ncbi:hypothetical protein SLEP1_g17345 [Rubroshorea leprosula]|uniref:Integrase catalytic domain-containing protein n=1 Tax=Rubroshorea leprosula TaxID=152421 RepID=A0AAV5ITX8_9ROSI|nr:hypothetical protein SLEP1_g17345 [Rubroshorea leprosula]
MNISLGTPPFPILVIADTGGDLIWTQCKPFPDCYKQDAPLYNPKSSSTYKTIPYSARQWDLALDTITLSSTSGRPVALPKTISGCGHNNDGTFNEKGSDIIGLGGGDVSLISQMGKSKGVVSAPLVKKTPDTFYFLTLEGISVDDETIDFLGSSVGSEGNIIIDSGTTLTLLPSDFYASLEDAVSSKINATPVESPMQEFLPEDQPRDFAGPFGEGSTRKVKMVHTRATQRESPPRGQGRGQPPIVNPVSQNAPIAVAQHQQVEGVGEHNPQYPNAVANDPVTVQLSAMQQQFGVFQLVLAQLLARDNPVDPLIHLLNPAPPAAPQPAQQPVNSPVRSVAPTASQAQSHIPPQPQNPHQPAASDVSKRLDNIEKLLAENKNPQPQTPPISASIPTLLNTKITQEPYPPGFRMPQFETYDGTKDPDDHLHAFFSIMQAQNASDALMCKMFPSTLRGNARTWYHTLRPNSINAYAELATSFATKFSSRRLIKKTTPELMRITQRDGESLKNYMNRFNDAMLEANAFDEAVGITAVIQGLNHDRFRDNLIKHTPTTFDEVNQRSLKFIKAEEYVLSKPQPPKEARTPAWREEGQSRKKFKPTQNRGPMPVPKLDRPGSNAPQTRPRPPSWTSFTIPRVIHMITGGPEAGGTSSKQQKLYVREVKHHNTAQKRKIDEEDWKNQSVTFTPADLEGVVTPHSDPLVTSVIINNCEVQRALIDIGSAPDIMYYHCFESLGLDPALLQKSRRNKEVVPSPESPHPETPNTQQVMGVELPDNRPKDEPRATPVEEVEEVQLDDNDPSKKTQIGTKLTPIEKEELVGFLKANKDVFAWTSADMPGIPTSVAVHKLNTNPLRKPVAQKRWLFGGERLTAIKEEVKKLLQAGFIRRVDYCEWIANPVMVKKSNGKWRMCIDYTNLNDARPKDCHPMPSIDKLVEVASRNERLSLLDAYSGYHQVRMAPKDEVKTSFYAGDEIYCYVMMPFGLKNAGATYQKMVTIVFRAQIGRNLEVYVDDIVVKSSRAEDHLTDLAETFNNLKRCSMKLNPAKCTFGVKPGKFLGFMVSRKGIEVNPEKIKAIEEMKPPRSTKDVQRLTGRVAALHRFISKSADKCLPFFKVAFDELKAYLSSPPLLTKAQEGEILYLYLGIYDTAVSSVLVREMGKQQQLVYYASKRSAIRAQALADFVVECTSNQVEPNSGAETWTLYIDGSSNNKGSEAGAVLTGPDSFRSEHALKFNFQATNNVAEYEALLLGLRLAAELKVKRLQIYISELKNRFEKFQLTKIPRTENEHANSLSKLASENPGEAQSVYIEILNEPSFQTSRVMEISTDPDAPNWTDPIREYLLDGTVPGDKQEKMKLQRKASRYTLVGDVLYKRSYSLPLLRCLTPYEAEYALREVHEGVCGSHVGAQTLAHKVLRQGYYWPNMQEDAKKFVQRCQKCQFFAHLTHQPAEELTSMTAPWPFAQWGVDLLGPYVKAVGGATHLVVVVNYFTKWVEAKPLSYLTSRRIEDFLFSSVICKYGIPNQIIADNSPQFNCNSFRDFCSSYGIKLVFTSVYHPEANGMVESVNKAILEGIKPRLDQLKTKWVDELNNVLWAYQTTSRTATGETPYHLAFGTEAIIPVEIGVPSLRISHFEPAQNERLLRENLNFLDEVREQSQLRTLAYKQRIANLYNKRVRPRNFRVGDLVLRKAGLTGFETRYGKLAPNWEGPYIVTEVPHPGAYILQDAEGKRVPRVWNVNNLKKFHP